MCINKLTVYNGKRAVIKKLTLMQRLVSNRSVLQRHLLVDRKPYGIFIDRSHDSSRNLSTLAQNQTIPQNATRLKTIASFITRATPNRKTEPVDSSKEHTVLIDASALIYRSFHAYSFLYNGAIYGFVKYLLRLRKELEPYTNIVILMDAPRITNFRTILYPDYKKNRTEVPKSLKDQFEHMREAAEACNIDTVTMAGYEADDLMAAYSKIARAKGHRVTLVTPDKDLLQLVDTDTKVYDVANKAFVGVNEVKGKWGVSPTQIKDLLSLMGDASDNIPGIFGIKTATSILHECKSVDNLIENFENLNLKPKQLKQNMILVGLKDEIPELPPVDNFKVKEIDEEKLLRFCGIFGFRSIINSWNKQRGNSIVTTTKPTTNLVADDIKQVILSEDEVPPTVDALTTDGTTSAADEVTTSTLLTTPLSEEDVERCTPSGVTVVRTREKAREVVAQLMTYRDKTHAIDTEVVDIDLEFSPVGQGKIICISIYCGPNVDFGNGPKIWVDNFGECEGVLDEFKPYLEDETIPKVYHNYSFDYHVLRTAGIEPMGLMGDTMHMARLWDSSRLTRGGYSLQGILEDLKIEGIDLKRSIKDRFASPKIKKDGTPSKIMETPDLRILQRDTRYLHDWIDYSTFDTEGTWHAREKLQELLDEMKWREYKSGYQLTMWDFYKKEWQPFAELLVSIEDIGIRVDTDYLKKVEAVALEDYQKFKSKFLEWASTLCPGAKHMNIDSDPQKQQLFFAPATGKKGKSLELEREFERENTEMVIEEGKKKALKKTTFVIRGIGMPAIEETELGLPAVSSKVLRELAGKNPEEGKYGTAYGFFGKGEAGREACLAINYLLEASATQTLLSTFIVPLQTLTDNNSRIHTSLNVNTETGRLSSRRPNLQNQPALEKDRYKIRKAFTAAEGKSLIVADYGQLELRLLAHITKCQSMIEAFQKGGDFHSRTVIGMYPDISRAVQNGEVLLEWDYSKGEPPVPLLKDKYSSERRKAKTLNFSIAYGKTAMGLSKDWGVSLNEAKETLARWYRDRPEVKEWQSKTIDTAIREGWTRTLMGRYRLLPDINSSKVALRNHSQRAAINTPLQGGAADVVIRAMVKLHQSTQLRELGWRQVLQVHDEIILEGPEENAEEAVQLVNKIMRDPLDDKLLVSLDVSGKHAKTWYEAK
ncbi:hypothetical protein PROFUN_10451 [Planoprotostelium fungivorum]|uniref:Uncharacterized protein n=1 Tax=Planoprotostelium fungivorum TaxID=1890364 RepID=A0A2P6NE06_9EUKA|nr:hypothetical protein PROFUN_10451 [Planoprotostelium fungivorum]